MAFKDIAAFNSDTRLVDVIDKLKRLAPEEQAEIPVYAKGIDTPLRLCAVRISEESAARARAHAIESARKSGRKISKKSHFLCDYIIAVTSLPSTTHDTDYVLEFYRQRWQIELYFKRLKSLLSVGHVPKVDPASAKAWLQAKLLTCLLIEELLFKAEVFSPWRGELLLQQPLT